MADDKELLKKMSNLFEETKKRKITDFDTGLLYDVFTPITGTPEERYEKWSARLVNIASRLENLCKDGEERLPILSEIDKFFKKGLPTITTNVSDYTQTSRIIKIEVDNEPGISSVPESLETTIKLIREEQYTDLSNIAKTLVFRAIAQLKKEFAWHREGLIGEIELDMEDNNGRNGESHS